MPSALDLITPPPPVFGVYDPNAPPPPYSSATPSNIPPPANPLPGAIAGALAGAPPATAPITAVVDPAVQAARDTARPPNVTVTPPPDEPAVRPVPPRPASPFALNVNPSPATSAIVAARDANTEPTVEGPPSALGGVIRAVVGAKPPPAAEAPIPPAEKPPEPPPAALQPPATQPEPAKPPEKVDLKKPIQAKGAGGGAARSLSGRTPEELPDANPKARISPTFLVELEKSNPALHDGIIQAATAAGIGSWDYANLIYATSKGDPNFNQGGRVGLAGLTQEDIERFKNERPELFRDSQGNPVSPQDPHTNLILGALKYHDLQAKYGTRDPQAILAFHLGESKVDSASRLTAAEQREIVAPAYQQVQQSVAGPDAGFVPPTPINITPLGTGTPSGFANAALTSARTGDTGPWIGYMVNHVPQGTGPTDAWKYAEAAMIRSFIAHRDVNGAQAARELVLQLSMAGATQNLMHAYQQMKMGDYHGAAQHLALAYWSAPDGGLVQLVVGKDKTGNPAMYGQRYNEETRNPVGPTFQVTPERIIDMLNITRDPQTYIKTVRDNQKLHAEIAEKAADADYKRAHAQYLRDVLPSRERTAAAAGEDRALAAAARESGRDLKGAGAPKVDPRVAHVDKLIEDAYGVTDPITQTKTVPPEKEFEASLVHNMRLNNDSMTVAYGQTIVREMLKNGGKGRYQVRPDTAKPGWGYIQDTSTNAYVGALNPQGMSRFRAPAAPGTANAPGAR